MHAATAARAGLLSSPTFSRRPFLMLADPCRMAIRLLFLLACVGWAGCGDAAVAEPAVVAPVPAAAPTAGGLQGTTLSGGAGDYVVRPGDNLTIVAARLGVRLQQLWNDNKLDRRAFIRDGQHLRYTNPHIAPAAPWPIGDAVLINIPQRMLFHYRDGALVAGYPVAVGRVDWPTPETDTQIATRERDKTWIVPPSIQDEMRENGQPVLTRVPPGPDNPLGNFWLGLALPGYGIHGTNAPASIYAVRTHGCIRLQAEHIEALYNGVTRGTPVRILYAPVLLYAPAGGPIWLEAHPDPYARVADYRSLARSLADAAGVTERTDWNMAASVLSDQAGNAVDVTLHGAEPATTPTTMSTTTQTNTQTTQPATR